jgi:hypothetical protein
LTLELVVGIGLLAALLVAMGVLWFMALHGPRIVLRGLRTADKFQTERWYVISATTNDARITSIFD